MKFHPPRTLLGSIGLCLFNINDQENNVALADGYTLWRQLYRSIFVEVCIPYERFI